MLSLHIHSGKHYVSETVKRTKLVSVGLGLVLLLLITIDPSDLIYMALSLVPGQGT